MTVASSLAQTPRPTECTVGHDVLLAAGFICGAVTAAMRPFDGSGLIVMPGLIDLHGDGFEGHVAPTQWCRV